MQQNIKSIESYPGVGMLISINHVLQQFIQKNSKTDLLHKYHLMGGFCNFWNEFILSSMFFKNALYKGVQYFKHVYRAIKIVMWHEWNGNFLGLRHFPAHLTKIMQCVLGGVPTQKIDSVSSNNVGTYKLCWQVRGED